MGCDDIIVMSEWGHVDILCCGNDVLYSRKADSRTIRAFTLSGQLRRPLAPSMTSMRPANTFTRSSGASPSQPIPSSGTIQPQNAMRLLSSETAKSLGAKPCLHFFCGWT